jgi:uncharacterized protein YqjF (DUF2071 family)
MLQSWRSVAFLHWGYEPWLVRPLVPPEVELDTWDGLAWVTLVPFFMEGVRPPGLPPLPWLSTSPETNVRTYIREPGGKPGIWFFSLDIARLPMALTGRAAYRLPYIWATMSTDLSPDDSAGRRVRYRGRRRWPSSARYHVAIELGSAYRDTELSERDHFLTARYLLYARRGPLAVTAFVEHPRWPLVQGTVLRLEENLLAHAGLPAPDGPPLVHFSPGVDVRIGRPHLSIRSESW